MKIGRLVTLQYGGGNVEVSADKHFAERWMYDEKRRDGSTRKAVRSVASLRVVFRILREALPKIVEHTKVHGEDDSAIIRSIGTTITIVASLRNGILFLDTIVVKEGFRSKYVNDYDVWTNPPSVRVWFPRDRHTPSNLHPFVVDDILNVLPFLEYGDSYSLATALFRYHVEPDSRGKIYVPLASWKIPTFDVVVR